MLSPKQLGSYKKGYIYVYILLCLRYCVKLRTNNYFFSGSCRLKKCMYVYYIYKNVYKHNVIYKIEKKPNCAVCDLKKNNNNIFALYNINFEKNVIAFVWNVLCCRNDMTPWTWRSTRVRMGNRFDLQRVRRHSTGSALYELGIYIGSATLNRNVFFT